MRSEIGIILNDVSLLGLYALNLSRFEQFPEDFHFLPLNFGDDSVFLLCFSDLDFFDSLKVLVSDVLLSFDDGLFDKLQVF